MIDWTGICGCSGRNAWVRTRHLDKDVAVTEQDVVGGGMMRSSDNFLVGIMLR